MKKIIAAITAVVLSATLAVPAFAADTAEPAMPQIQNFIGRSNAVKPDSAEGVGWERVEISWAAVEPFEGQINRSVLSELQTRLKNIQKDGKKILLNIVNPPLWAVRQDAFSFENDGTAYRIGKIKGVKYGELIRDFTVIGSDGRAATEEKVASFEANPLSDKGKEEWQNFVKKVLDEFGGYADYVQIYDSPIGNAESYFGTEEQFINDTFVPAAEILKAAGKKVVMPGLPNNYDIEEFVELADETNLWQKVDVYNLYEASMGSLDFLYNVLKEKGVETPYIWMTETGFPSSEPFIPNFYMRAFNWTLNHEAAANSDQFKLFWNEKPTSDKQNPLSKDGELTAYGKEIAALNHMLGGEKVEPFAGYQTHYKLRPQLFENDSASEGFLVDGKRVVVACHMMYQNSASIFTSDDYDMMHMNFVNSFEYIDVYGAADDAVAKRMNILGGGWEIPLERSGDKVNAMVSVPDTLAAPTEGLENTPEVRRINTSDRTSTFFLQIDASSFTPTEEQLLTPQEPEKK